MRRFLVFALVMTLCAWAGPAQGQGLSSLFSKRSRPNPSQRVPELIVTLKSDGDERKRAMAAEELRDYDARTYSEMTPVLIDALQHDQGAGVRLEALNTLSRLRPVSQSAGQAMEQAASNDASWRVRMQAKSALVKYHLAGYASGRPDQNPPRNVTTAEPPLADPPGIPAAGPQLPAPAPRAQPPVTNSAVPPTQGESPAPITIEVDGPSLTPQR